MVAQYIPVTLAFRRPKKENPDVEVNLSHITRLYLKKNSYK